MRKLLVVSLCLIGLNCFAQDSNIIVIADDSSTVVVALLDGELDESEVELLFEIGSHAAFYNGEICFNGDSEDVVEILTVLDEEAILGDEYSFLNIAISGKNSIKYQVLDGVNEVVLTEVTIKRCK